MRIILQLVMVLSGLLLAREFMTHSNEHLRLVVRWANFASENITTVHEAPTSVSPVAVGTIAEVSVQSIAIVQDAPAPIALITVVPLVRSSAQSIAIVHDEPPSVAQIAQVTGQSLPSVRRPPALVARKDVAQIAEVTPKSIVTMDDRQVVEAMNDIGQIAEVSKSIRTGDRWPTPLEVAPITTASVRSIDAVQDQSVLAPNMEVAQTKAQPAQSLAPSHERPPQLITSALAQTVQSSRHGVITVRDEPPHPLVPTVAPMKEVSTRNLVTGDEVPAPVKPMSPCELIWDQLTHMSRDEWAAACRRVDELRLVARDGSSPSGER
jgi:hypothetical protein